MYDQEHARQLRRVASDAMDGAQSTLQELAGMKQRARSEALERLLSWQAWLGTISFTLAGLDAALLINTSQVSGYALVSLMIFLLTGLWVALRHKTDFERSLTTATENFDVFMPLHLDKKKAALNLWENPMLASNHIAFVESELVIQKTAQKTNRKVLALIKKERPSYLNDLWLTLLLIAIYLLFHPYYSRLITTSHMLREMAYWNALLIPSLLILRQALRDRITIAKGKKSKLGHLGKELKHGDAYIKQIELQISSIKKQFKL